MNSRTSRGSGWEWNCDTHAVMPGGGGEAQSAGGPWTGMREMLCVPAKQHGQGVEVWEPRHGTARPCTAQHGPARHSERRSAQSTPGDRPLPMCTFGGLSWKNVC